MRSIAADNSAVIVKRILFLNGSRGVGLTLRGHLQFGLTTRRHSIPGQWRAVISVITASRHVCQIVWVSQTASVSIKFRHECGPEPGRTPRCAESTYSLNAAGCGSNSLNEIWSRFVFPKWKVYFTYLTACRYCRCMVWRRYQRMWTVISTSLRIPIPTYLPTYS